MRCCGWTACLWFWRAEAGCFGVCCVSDSVAGSRGLGVPVRVLLAGGRDTGRSLRMQRYRYPPCAPRLHGRLLRH
ncbi:hypothetical protein QBC39DRAFT_146091 [Podospora conica]|nr:hypothetical protein QBC39DRAFT_146091 [Schizothecium conicum]